MMIILILIRIDCYRIIISGNNSVNQVRNYYLNNAEMTISCETEIFDISFIVVADDDDYNDDNGNDNINDINNNKNSHIAFDRLAQCILITVV